MEYDAKEKKHYDKLMFGFQSQKEFLKSLQVYPIQKTIVIPVTTRSAGFMSQFLFCKFHRLMNAFNRRIESTVYQLYRVTLLQIEAKIAQCMGCTDDLFRRVHITFEQMDVLNRFNANFSLFANLVNAIGILKAFGTTFLPRLPAQERNGRINFVPEPTTVTFSNLRAIVSSLADRQTPWEFRMYFYEHSPLPGAHWGGEKRRPDTSKEKDKDKDDDQNMPSTSNEGDFPILLNPNDFMPLNYTQDDLCDDVSAIRTLLHIVGQKYPKYIYLGQLDFRRVGNPSILVSNDVGTLRCKDLAYSEDSGPNYNNEKPLVGNLDRFWSPEFLTDLEFYLGVNHLFGERPQEKVRTDAHTLRSPICVKQDALVDYETTIFNLLG